MATSFGALCTDFYINHKLTLKMDLPGERDTVLHFFDRVRKSMPAMNRFRRFEEELVLESSRREAEYQWLAMRRTSLRTGHVNPESMEDAYKFHRNMLELAPHYLSLAALDVDYQELVFGFDLECQSDHDDVIFEALYAGTPMAKALELPGTKKLDVQPVFGLSLTPGGEVQAYFEIKTRRKSRRGSSKAYRGEPISLFLTLRKYGPVEQLSDLTTTFDHMAEAAEKLATEQLVPHWLTPIAKLITSGSA